MYDVLPPATVTLLLGKGFGRGLCFAGIWKMVDAGLSSSYISSRDGSTLYMAGIQFRYSHGGSALEMDFLMYNWVLVSVLLLGIL